MLGSGLLTLWGSLLLLKLQQKAQRRCNKFGSHAHDHGFDSAGLLDAGKVGGVSCKGMREGRSAAAVAAAAVAASVSGIKGKLVAAAAGGLQLQLPPTTQQQLKQGVTTAGSRALDAVDDMVGSTMDGTAEAEAVQLLQPAVPAQLGSTCPQCIHVELGRPQLKGVVKAWLATQQQQLGARCHNSSRGSAGGAGRSEQCYTVYGMGPEELVMSVQRLCDDVGGLHFVRKTHRL